MEIKSLIFYFYALILAIIYTKCVHTILISTASNNDGAAKEEQVKVVTIVNNTMKSKIEYSNNYRELIYLLRDILATPQKPFKETTITKRFRPLNIKLLSHNAFYKSASNEIVNFFNLLKANYNHLFNNHISSDKLDEYNDNFDEARKYFNSLFNANKNKEYDVEKYFLSYYKLKKYINLSVSINFRFSTGFIILIAQIDQANNKFNLKFTDYLTRSDIKVLEDSQTGLKDNDLIIENLISTMKGLRVYINTGVFDSPKRHLEQLCSKYDYDIPSKNWLSYFHPHNETLCRVQVVGNGDCFFSTLKHLLFQSGIDTTNYSPPKNVKESNFIPWYLNTIRKHPDKTPFNVIDLRYITTYYTIKYFPGYNKDSDLDSKSLKSMLEMLTNLEYSNYNLKKKSLITKVQSKFSISKLLGLESGLAKKIKSIFIKKKDKKARKTNKKSIQKKSQNADPKYKKNKSQGVIQAPNESESNKPPALSKRDVYTKDNKRYDEYSDDEDEEDEEDEQDEQNQQNEEEVYNYDEILEDLHGFDNRMFELIFFKLISLKENNITDFGIRNIPSNLIPTLKGKVYKSKVLASHLYAKTPKRGDVFPFFNFHDVTKQLHHPFNKYSYHNKDIYAVILHTTFHKVITRKRDKKKTYSMLFAVPGDDLSYSSILNNDYHFAPHSIIVETKTMQQKAAALFFGRTRPGHSHWGDETDYNAFQKMFNIGLITFMHDSTKLFFPKMNFNEYPKYFLIYFFSELHFEPGVHVSYDQGTPIYNLSYDRNNIPNSILTIS
ncbi:conserved Plasmodium protein, unknown function [Plasmodium vinckei vinckei]|uniref:OTU domain-containing protein n=1 Tax=Plasmodium vinckei vinckei TaxID=54757 RepID=A0A449BZB3_PLAVN|nr:conserved Plasmodium protein, unknown function [Plasmodium vinckei vinckei]KEG05070.1 hypothetical protein YYE_00649 [Plasmodium vinckei vinckei]VEV58722.1 conserved Plasmodium protein, unknown function [Plasmodium vinckei vinckei]